MNIYFYNAWHNGDLHVSRSFVRYIMKHIKADSYNYYHPNLNKILQDIDGLNQIPFKKSNIDLNDGRGYFKKGNDYYINTWYGSYDFKYLFGEDMTIFCLYNIFKKTLKELFKFNIDPDPVKFFAKIDYSKFDVKDIDDFILKDNRKKVLICNNTVESFQSNNFDFNPIIRDLADKQPNILFVITNIMNNVILEKDNIIYCNTILPKIYDNNLNEISYISRFCDIIVGRYSGPQSFAGTYDNYLDPTKTFISFVTLGKPNRYGYGDCSFGSSLLLPQEKRAKFVYSGNFKSKSIINIIEGELK